VIRAVLALVILLSLAGTAQAARPPTRTERPAITKALASSIRTLPANCVTVRMRVSASGWFARAWLRWRQPDHCGAVSSSNGQWFLKRTARGWRVVYVGSDPPPCRLRIPRDLTTCIR
jgi:hypothetical protein